MFSWLEEFYRIRKEYKSCESCHSLRTEKSALLNEIKRLTDKLLEDKVEIAVQARPEELKPILPRNLSWNQRRTILEAESKRQAQILKLKEEELKQPERISTADLEAELDVVSNERGQERANAIR